MASSVFVAASDNSATASASAASAGAAAGKLGGFSATRYLESLGVNPDKSKLYLTIAILLAFHLARHFLVPTRGQRRQRRQRRRQEASAVAATTPQTASGGDTKEHPMIITKEDNVPTYKRLTPPELAAYNGSDKNKPLFMAVKGDIFDVSRGASFYGPEGPYHNFAGRDASRGLAKNSFEEDVLTPLADPIDLLLDLDKEEVKTLDDWHIMFTGKYSHVGFLINSPENDAKKADVTKGDNAEQAQGEKSDPPASLTDTDDDDGFEKVEAIRPSDDES